MTNSRHANIPGATWFFTVNLTERKENRLLIEYIDDLRKTFRYVKETHPFQIKAIVILPDHLHCIWRLPPDDTDFSARWNVIKGQFSRSISQGQTAESSEGNAACGNAVFGNILFEMNKI